MPESREIRTQQDIDDLAEHLRENLGNGVRVEFGRLTRTGVQNNSLHQWLGLISTRLNDAGYGVRGTLSEAREGFEVPWTAESVKELLYRPVMKSQTGKSSTTELTTVEPSEICKIVGQRISEITGITAPPWPDRFNGGGRE